MLERGHEDLKMPRVPRVIGIKESHVSAGCDVETSISGRGRAGIRLVSVDHSRVGPESARDEFTGAIDRTVVDDDDLDLRMLLAKHAVDGLAQECCAIEAGDDDADCG